MRWYIIESRLISESKDEIKTQTERLDMVSEQFIRTLIGNNSDFFLFFG